MSSKLDYLQRYLSGGSGEDAAGDGEKKNCLLYTSDAADE